MPGRLRSSAVKFERNGNRLRSRTVGGREIKADSWGILGHGEQGHCRQLPQDCSGESTREIGTRGERLSCRGIPQTTLLRMVMRRKSIQNVAMLGRVAFQASFRSSGIPSANVEDAHCEDLHEEEHMIRMIVISLAMMTAAVIPAVGAQEVKQEPKPHTQAFLKKTAEEQQAAISLALLADGRAANTHVREFADHMIAIHKKLLREVQELAAGKGVNLPSALSDEHAQKIKEFSQLSGHAFDRMYMHYILRDHQIDVGEFEEAMQTLEDSDVLHWTYRTLPMLRAHVEEARWLQQSLQTN